MSGARKRSASRPLGRVVCAGIVTVILALPAGCTADPAGHRDRTPHTTSAATPAPLSDTASTVTSPAGSPAGSSAIEKSQIGKSPTGKSQTIPMTTTRPPSTPPTTDPPATDPPATDPPTTEATASTPALPTTPVPPPVTGDIHDVVHTRSIATLPATPLTARARPESDVTVAMTHLRSITSEARFPGEIAGAGLEVTLRMTNAGATPINLDHVIVDLRGSDGTRGVAVSGGTAAPFAGSLPPGHAATAVYVFTIPEALRHPISVRFSYSARTPTVLFAGDPQ